VTGSRSARHQERRALCRRHLLSHPALLLATRLQVFDFKKAMARQQRDWERGLRAATAAAKAAAATAATAAAIAASGDPSLSVTPSASAPWRRSSASSAPTGPTATASAASSAGSGAATGILLSAGDDLTLLRAAGSGSGVPGVSASTAMGGATAAVPSGGSSSSSAHPAPSDDAYLKDAAAAAAAASADADADAAVLMAQSGPPGALKLRRYRCGRLCSCLSVPSLLACAACLSAAQTRRAIRRLRPHKPRCARAWQRQAADREWSGAADAALSLSYPHLHHPRAPCLRSSTSPWVALQPSSPTSGSTRPSSPATTSSSRGRR
jgi:hypothetical protein